MPVFETQTGTLLALSVGPKGIGAAIERDGQREEVGYFEDIGRVLRHLRLVPEHAVLIVPHRISEKDLKWYLGEMVIAGIAVQRVQVRSSFEVLGPGIVLIDASHERLITPDEQVHPCSATAAGQVLPLLQDYPDAPVILLGNEEEAGAWAGAEIQKTPELKEFRPTVFTPAALALRALNNPSTESLITPGSPSKELPVSGSGMAGRNIWLLAGAALLILAAVLFL